MVIGNFLFNQQIDFSRFLKMAFSLFTNKSTFPDSSKWQFPFVQRIDFSGFVKIGSYPFVQQIDLPRFLKMAISLFNQKYTFPDSSKWQFPFCLWTRILGRAYRNMKFITFRILKWYPKTQYLTLGPKFYTKLATAITRRRMHLNQWFRCESAPIFA